MSGSIFIVGPFSFGALSATGTSGYNHWKMANIADMLPPLKKKNAKCICCSELKQNWKFYSLHTSNQSLKDFNGGSYRGGWEF